MQDANPEKQLNKDEVAEGRGNVQRSSSVGLAVRHVNVLLLAVRQHQDRVANVLTSNCVHQLLRTTQHKIQKYSSFYNTDKGKVHHTPPRVPAPALNSRPALKSP